MSDKSDTPDTSDAPQAATDDIVKETVEPGRYEPQFIDLFPLPIQYEVWRNGVFFRKSLKIKAEDPPPPIPSLNEDCPPWHAFRLQQITGRGCYIKFIGRRADDEAEQVGLKYLHSHVSDEEFKALGETEQERRRRELGGPGPVWKDLWVSYEAIADTKKLMELAARSFPVCSGNMRELSNFLVQCYDANAMLFRRKVVVRRAGYHEVDGVKGWLHGKRWIGPSSDKIMPFPEEDKLSQALHAKGDIENWKSFVIEQVEKDPQRSWVIRFFLGCSFASPLLRFIDRRTFFVHHYCQAGGSKSVLLYLSQSVWGHPKQFSHSLNRSTQNALTEVFKYVSDFPLALDELQGKEVDTSNFIMQACTEEHKARVQQAGGLTRQDAKAWRTIIRTTGEQTLAGADQADAGGQARRALEIRHPGLSKEQGTEIWKWVEKGEHYGIVGCEFLRHLFPVVNNIEHLETLQAKYATICEELAKALDWDLNADHLRHLGAIALGEYLMLRWTFDYESDLAFQTAIADARRVGQSHLRVQDASSMMDRGVDLLLAHRAAYANQYADITTEIGTSMLKSRGTRSSAPVVAVLRGDEIWYLDPIDKYLKEALGVPPNRFWEDLAECGILLRDKDRLKRQRQIKGIISAKAYVVDARKLEAFSPEPVVVEPSEVSVPDVWYDYADDEYEMESDPVDMTDWE